MSETTRPQSAIEYRKADDFASAYANNAFLESSLWDLRVIFGQNDQQLGENVVVQHTAMTLPWAQIKVMIYFMQTHLLAHEIQNGRIMIPPNLILPIPEEPPKDALKQIPKLPEIHVALRKHYETFIAANPEAIPIPTKPDKSAKQ